MFVRATDRIKLYNSKEIAFVSKLLPRLPPSMANVGYFSEWRKLQKVSQALNFEKVYFVVPSGRVETAGGESLRLFGRLLRSFIFWWNGSAPERFLFGGPFREAPRPLSSKTEPGRIFMTRSLLALISTRSELDPQLEVAHAVWLHQLESAPPEGLKSPGYSRQPVRFGPGPWGKTQVIFHTWDGRVEADPSILEESGFPPFEESHFPDIELADTTLGKDDTFTVAYIEEDLGPKRLRGWLWGLLVLPLICAWFIGEADGRLGVIGLTIIWGLSALLSLFVTMDAAVRTKAVGDTRAALLRSIILVLNASGILFVSRSVSDEWWQSLMVELGGALFFLAVVDTLLQFHDNQSRRAAAFASAWPPTDLGDDDLVFFVPENAE